MTSRILTGLAALAMAVVLSAPVAAQDLSDQALVNTVPVRSIGPAVMSGRVVDIAVAFSPGVRGGELGTVFYVAAASGGVWKTTNGGMSFEPVFDDAGVGSIGDIAVDPSNSNIVWVGTGENNSQRSSSYGDGVYRSLDGGESFQHMGLGGTQHVGRILVHPEDSDVVYVASSGPLWAGGGERGLFRTLDGGESWELILEGENRWTGVTDIVMDPTDHDVLYAATYQRERRAYGFIGGGPGSGIWKSTDGGESWTELTRGLPQSDMGRIGLSLAASQPNTVYAIVESNDEAGLYRTDNAGASWRMMSDIESIPWYFGQVRADPTDADVVYHLGVYVQRSVDGGRTWRRADGGGIVHVDHHALWISPENPDLLILGNDGGLYVSRDRGESWDFSVNLPVSQFYAVGVDMAEPFFNVYGGLQDNNTWGGPSRTRSQDGIFNSDWFITAGGDGFYAAIDPTDPNIAYVESQNGNINRYDKRTGDLKPIRPLPPVGAEEYRFNWSAPIKISPWDPSTIYFGANHAFKSTDRGDTWTVLGEDLTRAIDRDSLQMMGRVPGEDAVSRHQGVADFGNISTLDVSRVQQGLLATGSDDGVIAISMDDGQSWMRHLSFPGVPDTAYVSKVRLSAHDANVVYATFDNHRSNDFRPYVLRSTDQGRSWSSISANLPEFGSVRAFAEHPENPDLLFVGTEIAPWVSVDGGGSWTRITNGMPPVRIDDILVHPRDNTLVIATHGRGFYLIDDLEAFEELGQAKVAGGPHLFDVESELLFTPDGSPTSGTHATRDFRGENPPVGTTVSYLLPESASEVSLEILGPSGDVVRELDAPGGAGLHHVRWDFRVDAPWNGPPQEQRGGGGSGGFGGGGSSGAPAVPGPYAARLTVDGTAMSEAFEVRADANVTLTAAQLRQLFDIRMEQMGHAARYAMANRQLGELSRAVQDAMAAMEEVEVPESLQAMADTLKSDVDEIRERLGGGGGGFFGASQYDDPPTVQQLVRVSSGVHRATTMPTAQERDALSRLPGALDAQVARINEIVSGRLDGFYAALDDAGVPWSPGRPIR